MDNLLAYGVVILLIIVLSLMLNEKYIRKANEIVILIVSIIIGIFLNVFIKIGLLGATGEVMETITHFSLDKVLLDGTLCFMLFTGASELKLTSLVHNITPISLLALLTTVISSAVYGLLFWGATSLLGFNLGFEICFLLGAIVSPTDPIAATAILNKMGLTKNVTAIMEGESLFNDGTGVALFIFIKNLILDTEKTNFFVVMGKELFGAILVGIVISFLCSLLIKMTIDPVKHIIISIMAVSACYVICDALGFSGVIASVVCGIYFSTMMDRYKARKQDLDPNDYYKDFWSVVDKIFNYVLYVMIGLSFVFVTRINHILIIAIAAIVFNFVARYVGVFISLLISKQCPDGYHDGPLTLLMTWSGLKGGLCLALAMSAREYLYTETYDFILFVTFVTILFTTIVQGLSVGRLYGYLKQKYRHEEA